MNKICDYCDNFFWGGDLIDFVEDKRKLTFNNEIRIDLKVEECEKCYEKKMFFYYLNNKIIIKRINKDKEININNLQNVLLMKNDYKGFLYKERKNDVIILLEFYLNMEGHYLIEIGKGYLKQEVFKIKDIIYLSSVVNEKMKKEYFECFYKTGENEKIFNDIKKD